MRSKAVAIRTTMHYATAVPRPIECCPR